MDASAQIFAQYSKLSRLQKAMFLTQVSHSATIAAREAYIPTDSHPDRTFEKPDGRILISVNNFIHGVTGYLVHVLDGTDNDEQDESVVEMIADRFDAKPLFDMLGTSART